LSSRVADNLFWLGRHAERAEHILRLLRSAVVRLGYENTLDDASELSALLQVFVGLDLLPSKPLDRLSARDLEQEIFTFLFKQSTSGGLRQTLVELRRLASMVRDRLSVDTSRILNQLHQDFQFRQGRLQFTEVLAHCNRMITDLAAFAGMEMENMTRGHGWRFLDMGRRLERSLNLTRLLRTAVMVRPSEDAILEPLLEVADSAMTYRRVYFARPVLPFVLDLLLADATNSRALAFQLNALSEHVQHLPRDLRAPRPTREERLVADAVLALRDADVEALSQAGDERQFPSLTLLADSLEGDLRSLSDAITHFYFSHAELRIS
jgi:uncharacterized alpha-E superfamily protein